MASVARGRPVAVACSILAAFVWSTYYVFVLAISPPTRPSAVLFYPFLFGGVAYAGWAFATGAGRDFLRLWKQPGAYLRTALLVGMQTSVLASTYLTGPVDASLLSLIGDVVATPLIVALVLAAYRAHVRSSPFVAGLLLSLVGGTLTIVGGRSLSGVHGVGWLAVPAVPLTVAPFFILTARENERTPSSAVVGQSLLASTIVLGLLAPVVPGGWPGLGTVSVPAFAVLVIVGLTSFFLAEALYFFAIERVGLVIPPMLMTGIPVFTLVLSGLVLGLRLPPIALLGIPIAIVGALLILQGERPAPPDPSVGPLTRG